MSDQTTIGANRHLRHLGPVHPDRIESFASQPVATTFTLQPGLTLCEAVAGPLAELGIRSGALLLSGMKLGPMQFVMPTWSKTPDHVAYYSETYRPEGMVAIDFATATFGERDGGPFLHCHALWRGPQGEPCGGHILPFDTIVAEATEASVYGSRSVTMAAAPDAETNFTLFRPAAVGATGGACIVARIRPNEDLVGAIETVCQRHGLKRARVRSGIGSTVGAVFEDGLRVDQVPTEIVVLDGRIAPDADGAPRATLDIALIDAFGRIHRGTPTRGCNPVLICFELILQAETDT